MLSRLKNIILGKKVYHILENKTIYAQEPFTETPINRYKKWANTLIWAFKKSLEIIHSN